MANVTLTPEAQKQVDDLPKTIRVRMLKVVERLQDWPDVSGAKPLKGDLKGYYRIRTGDYRLQFRVEGENVIITKAGHRDGFYQD